MWASDTPALHARKRSPDMASSQIQRKIRDMDQRVITLAEALIQYPPGIIRDGLVLQLGLAIQTRIDQWFHEMQQQDFGEAPPPEHM
jgi:ABC-type antimicrobial peptide transport system ATPase subunit